MTAQTFLRPAAGNLVRNLVHRAKDREQAFDHFTAPARPVSPARMKASTLQEAEDQLLSAVIDHHPRAESALDAALDDLTALRSELHESRRQPLLLRSTRKLNRIEDLLLEAIVRTHPNRERALDSMLADLVGAESPAADSEHRERVAFDCDIDNDFDGWG
jgi:hypothetical protein